MDLFLVASRFPERSETFIYRKAIALAERGHGVVVGAREIGDWSLYPRPSSIHVEQFPLDDALIHPSRALRAVATAARLATRSLDASVVLAARLARERAPRIERIRYFLQYVPFINRKADVIHFEFLSLAAIYPLAREISGKPVVVSCRGSDIHTLEHRPPIERDVMVQLLLRSDAVHCVSAHMAREVTRITGRTEGLWINRPAVPLQELAPRQHTGRRLRLLATGRFVWKKGFDYLLAALAVLVHRGVDFEAEIIGDGELRNYMRFSIEDLGLQQHVRLVGAVSPQEVLERMRNTDVFVLSSVAEGISNAVLEAMASGLPVVTTNAGGMAEAVTDGVEGFVVAVRDAAALADRIERLARDTSLRAKMGRAARRRAEAEFSLSRQAAIFERMYASVVRS